MEDSRKMTRDSVTNIESYLDDAVAQDCRDGVFSGTNDLVEKLTGQKPMQMLDYIVKNKALFC
jgi:hypothetical protein